MADISDFQPVYDENEDSISTRVFNDADEDIDKRPGEIFHDLVMPVVQEMAKLWDSVNEIAGVTFLPWSYGPYLDYKGAYEIGLLRRDPSNAYVDITFVGVRDDQGRMPAIPSDTLVTTLPLSDDDVAIDYTTTFTARAGLPDPTTAPSVSPDSKTGMNPPDPVHYMYTWVGRGGETFRSPIETVTLGPDEAAVLSDMEVGLFGTEKRNIYRSHTGTNIEDFYLIGSVTNNSGDTYVDVNNDWSLTPDPDTSHPGVNTTDRVTIEAIAALPGEDGNVNAGTLTKLPTKIQNVVSVYNECPVCGGWDAEGDDDCRGRLLAAASLWQGQGNKDDYKRWAEFDERVGDVVVLNAQEIQDTGIWPDPASRVHVVLIGPDNSVVSEETVRDVQIRVAPDGYDEGTGSLIDDPPGTGIGYAPLGARVTVRAASGISIVVRAENVTFEQGWTLGGEDETGEAYSGIIDNLTSYFASLPGDGDVMWSEVLAAIVTAPGVANVPFNEMYMSADGIDLNPGDDVPVSAIELAILKDTIINLVP